MEYVLGVDLGTTYTAAAVHVDGRVEMVALGSRRAEMPSLVHLAADGRATVGESAERHGRTDPGRLVREVKRRLGDPVPLLVGGVPYPADALLARILRHVVDTVTARHDGPPARVVVTHPANWGPYKREQVQRVFRGAGLTGVRTVTEPEAAAIHHASTDRVPPGDVVAVYDLGGGTFDAAVLRRTGGGYTVLGAPEGIEQLGGADFDDAVLGHVTGVLGAAMADPDPADATMTAALVRLRADCVEAKEALSDDTDADIPVALPGLHTRVRITRAEFEALIRPALDDTVAALRRALASAGVTPDRILLSGGSSRIPLVGELLTAAFDRPVARDPHPEHSIALGAALLAGSDFAPTRIGAIPPVPPTSPRSPAPAPPTAAWPETAPPGTAPPAATPETALPAATPETALPAATPETALPRTEPRSPAPAGALTASFATGDPAAPSTGSPAEPAFARGVAGVPPRPETPGPDDPGPGRRQVRFRPAFTRRRAIVAAAFFGVLVSTGAATAWALQSGPPETAGDRPVVTAGSALGTTPAPSAGTATSRTAPSSSAPERRPTTSAAPLTVSVSVSARRTSADDACRGFRGLTVRARISAGRTTTVSYRWSDGSATLERGSVRVPGGESRFTDVTVGRALAPGRSRAARVRIAVTSPAGTESRSIRLSLSCPRAEPPKTTSPPTPTPDPDPDDPPDPDPSGRRAGTPGPTGDD